VSIIFFVLAMIVVYMLGLRAGLKIAMEAVPRLLAGLEEKEYRELIETVERERSVKQWKKINNEE
jgi:hypothetical protein